MTKHRIWELDALRGFCILAMVVFHLVYDLTELYGLVSWRLPPLWQVVQEWGGVVFVALSGLSATLGSRPLRRGLLVLACGMGCTVVTWLLYRFGLSASSMVIRFGVLHCLGLCMMLWPLFRPLPARVLALLGAAACLLGLYFGGISVKSPFLFPLGLTTANFSSGDYFPLLPNLGWFLLGAVLGRSLYPQKRSLLPKIPQVLPIRFLKLCGRLSLPIYLIHQPLLCAILGTLQP